MSWSSLWSVYTLLMLVLFIGIAVWAWSSKRHREFAEAAHLPFADEAPEKRPEGSAQSKEKNHE